MGKLNKQKKEIIEMCLIFILSCWSFWFAYFFDYKVLPLLVLLTPVGLIGRYLINAN
jgi:hypothetical protein